MEIKTFLKIINDINSGDFFVGVPDSQLKPLCNYLNDKYGISEKHIIAANEGNAVAIAAGYYFATRKIPVVYLQNSGIGNIINPVASLLNEKVYGIPCIFIVGWRGEPSIKDEPQHIFQGEITLKLLEDVGIKTYVISKEKNEHEIKKFLNDNKIILEQGKSIAFVIKKNAFEYNCTKKYKNYYDITREEYLKEVVKVSDKDIIISTTGKTSRELFEIRENNHQSHKFDFLTVGSMGHCSSIALSIALSKPQTKVWCIDGDGAALMHLGAMAVIGAICPKNLIHIVINNNAHESVGGMPTVTNKTSLDGIARNCGYQKAISVDNINNFTMALQDAKKSNILYFIEAKATIGSRDDLGRPTTTAIENKICFMDYLEKLR